jgi:uncharacterized pyridoxamine 5'-phosphate oxidase family protein
MINFSLYHGTSSYFLNGILVHGLGGKNISNEWRISDFFEEVIFECKKVDDLDFQKHIINSHPILDRLLGKSHNPNGFNYRYGSVYLAVDPKRATQYALREFGSELSRIALGWYSDLKKFNPDIAFNLLEKYPQIKDIYSAAHRPIVIEIKDIDLHEIATEGGLIGNDLENELNKFPGFIYEGSILGLSFEYIGKPLMKDRLFFYEVEHSGNLNNYSALSAKLIPKNYDL